MTTPQFIIDSNILIESKRIDYGFDICPGFWDLLRKAFEAGVVISHNKVLQEIRRVNDDLNNWASGLSQICFPRENAAEFAVYQKLCSWARNGGYRPSAINQFCDPNYADPWICAKAAAEGLTLVTQEVSEPHAKRSIKLPDACIHISVPFCNKYDMLRALNARFVLDAGHSFI